MNGYRRPIDNATMVEVAAFQYVNSASAIALGLIASGTRVAMISGDEEMAVRRAELPAPAERPQRQARRRPTDAEFEELKRKRDESVREQVATFVAEQGWDPAQTAFHASHMHGCYCACPEGPCQHVWDGPEEEGDNYSSATCSRCGTSAMSHDMRCAS